MSDPAIEREVVTAEALKSLFEKAGLAVSVDTDGDLILEAPFRIYVSVSTDGKTIWIYAIFRASPEVTVSQKLHYANRVNDLVKIVRCCVADEGAGNFIFDYYVCVEGGVSGQAIVHSLRLFSECVGMALSQDGEHILA